MNRNLFGNLLIVERDEDFRKSLNPINASNLRKRQFTKFIKFREDSSVNKTTSLFTEYHQQTPIVFQTLQKYDEKKELKGSELLNRYRDQSWLVEEKEKSFKQIWVFRWSRLLSWIYREKQHESTFRKDSTWLLLWNVLVMLSYLWNIFEVPVALFFTEVVYQAEVTTLQGLIINWFFILVILLNVIFVFPNTQFEKRGYLIESRRQIISNYCRLELFIDLIGVVILIIYYAAGLPQLIYLKIFFYLNLLTVLRLDNLILGYLELKLYALAFYKLLRLEVFILFIVFWLSSIFFAIDYHYYQVGPYQGIYNWLTSEPCTTAYPINGGSFGIDLIQTSPWYVWLNYAAYWCLQTISTVGYGDMTPRNPTSVAFTNFTILIVMFFFVFFINSIIEIIDEMTSAEEKQRKANIKLFKEYYNESQREMAEIAVKFGYDQRTIEENKKVAEETADNIRSYLYEMDLNNLLDEENNVENLVYGNLTPQLREELFLNYRQLFFKKILLFGEIAKISPKFIDVYEELIYKIKEVPYGSQEIVYLNRENDSNSLYFLLRGSLLLKYPLSKYTKLLSDRSDDAESKSQFLNFGVREFITQQWRDHIALTMSYCKIQTLQFQDFQQIIKKYSQFYNKYCELRDCVLVERINIYTGEECLECNSKRHHLLNCSKCLFNITNSIRNTIFNNGPKPSKKDYTTLRHLRTPNYLRDAHPSKKVIAKSFMKTVEPKFQIISNFNEYSPKRNIVLETFN